MPQALLEMMYKSSNSECDASDNINSGHIHITLGVGRIFDILKQTMRMSWIEILKYNDLEFCPRRSQRTCWGHSGSSRGQDCAYRRSSSLSPTILIFFILPILFLFLLLFFFHLCILLLLHFPSFSISFSSLFLSICFSCPPNSLLNPPMPAGVGGGQLWQGVESGGGRHLRLRGNHTRRRQRG